VTTTTDNQGNETTPVNLNLKQVGDVLFALGQALKVGSIPVTLASDQGAIPVLDTNSASSNTHLGNIDTATSDLVADLDALITNTTGLATQSTLASAKADLDTIVTNTNKIPASPATEGGHLATIDTSTAAMKTDLDTIVTNTNKIPASPAQEAGNLATLVPGVQGWIAATGTGTAGQDDTLTFAQQVRKIALYNASANNVPLEFDQTATAASFPIPPGAFWIIDGALCTAVHVFPSATLAINTTSGLYVKGWK
jgi:hypothetical protein